MNINDYDFSALTNREVWIIQNCIDNFDQISQLGGVATLNELVARMFCSKTECKHCLLGRERCNGIREAFDMAFKKSEGDAS